MIVVIDPYGPMEDGAYSAIVTVDGRIVADVLIPGEVIEISDDVERVG